MRLVGRVSITAQVEINSAEAEVLHLLTSYDLAKWFAEKANRTMTADQIKDVLGGLRTQLNKIIAARDEALEVLNGTTP